ncbi:MAG: ABC transporter ATP-binding protein [Chlamydiae bacterium]|nr:ABC transporter ATP-binding protein [Chlamydiota bacterium]MBI3276616.1 ABC transporter ATP-binding protein [Chlamydiota bacterium]
MHFLETIQKLYDYAKPYRKQFALGILALLAVDLLQVLPPLILKKFIDQASLALTGDPRLTPFIQLGLLYASIAVGQGICRYFWRMFLIKGSFNAAQGIREEYFKKLQRLPPSFYDHHPIGDLMSLATNDVEAIRFALGPGLLVLADATFFLMSIPPAMFILSPKLASLALAPMLIVPWVIAKVEKHIHHRFEKVQEQFSKLSAFAQENLEGIRIIKAFTREWTQIQRFKNIGKEFVHLNVKLTQAQGIFEPLFTLAVSLGLVSLLLFTGKDVISGRVSLGTLVAFTRYLEQLVWPMMAFGLSVTYYQRGKTSLERIFEVLKEKEEFHLEIFKQPPEKNTRPSQGVSRVEAKNLTFSYPGQKNPVLKNISFRLEPGSRTALVGPIGSGKSTLVHLLTGLYDAPPNMLFWNGLDITTLPLSYRREKIAVVSQDVFLFLESLRWNILLGSNHDIFRTESDDAFLYTLLQKSGLEKESRLWNLDLNIGERGLNLSGGQKSRVTLARALIRKASLLILDDALSSVDTQTEANILNHLSGHINASDPKSSKHDFGASLSLLMITHRFARLSEMDQLLVFNQGELVEQGSPKKLEHETGLYRQLLQLQRIEDELAR